MAAKQEGPLYDGFIECCTFGGGARAGKKTVTTKNLTKWFNVAGVISKSVTTTDVDIAFSKFKTKGQTEMTFSEFVTLCESLGESKLKDKEGIKKKLVLRGIQATGTTKTSKTGGVDKMTDASQYTGSHKERFDAETGKGKGIEGRVDRDAKAEAGYVGNYKGEGTYDKKK